MCSFLYFDILTSTCHSTIVFINTRVSLANATNILRFLSRTWNYSGDSRQFVSRYLEVINYFFVGLPMFGLRRFLISVKQFSKSQTSNLRSSTDHLRTFFVCRRLCNTFCFQYRVFFLAILPNIHIYSWVSVYQICTLYVHVLWFFQNWHVISLTC